MGVLEVFERLSEAECRWRVEGIRIESILSAG